MTRKEIAALEASPGARVPVRFTGRFRGVHYYRGVQWRGPTNAVGHGKAASFRSQRNAYATASGKMTLIEETCVQSGELSLVCIHGSPAYLTQRGEQASE